MCNTLYVQRNVQPPWQIIASKILATIWFITCSAHPNCAKHWRLILCPKCGRNDGNRCPLVRMTATSAGHRLCCIQLFVRFAHRINVGAMYIYFCATAVARHVDPSPDYDGLCAPLLPDAVMRCTVPRIVRVWLSGYTRFVCSDYWSSVLLYFSLVPVYSS